jgi:methyl-accepting chemotaxis protein
MERASNAETIGVMTEKIAQKSRLSAVYMGTVLIILALAFLISYYTITNVSGSLQMLKVASDRVSRGYTDVEIQVHSTDEAGELANSFRKLVDKNIQLSKAAEAIGEGRYEVEIEAHYEGDILANALLQMKRKLLTFSVENANRQWHLSGLSELNNQMSGTQEMQSLNQRIIQFLTGYTQASVGVLYLLDDYEKLNFASGFAVNTSIDRLPSYTLGEGQVGQAAVDRKVESAECGDCTLLPGKGTGGRAGIRFPKAV